MWYGTVRGLSDGTFKITIPVFYVGNKSLGKLNTSKLFGPEALEQSLFRFSLSLYSMMHDCLSPLPAKGKIAIFPKSPAWP